MFEAAASSYRRLLVGWVDWVRRSALGVIPVAVAVTVAAVWFTATHMGINTDTTDMLSPDLEFRRHSRALSEAFPQLSDNLLVVIDGDNPDLANDAAELLGERLRRQPELFGGVFDPAGDPFFRKNGLLYLDVDELTELADRLAGAQPFLGALWRDPSLGGLFEMLGLILDEAAKGDAPMEVDGVLDAVAEVAEARAEGRFARLSWRELMMGRPAKKSERRRLVLIQPTLDFGSLQPASDAMEALRGMVRELRLTPENGVSVRLTGSAALAQEELKSVEEGMGLAAVLSLCLVVGLLLVGLRSLRLAGAILVTLVMGLIWTAAFAVLAVGQLNLISVAFAVLFIGLSVDFGIHFGLRYKEAIDGGKVNEVALREAAEGVGGALTLCAVAAAIGFFSFLPTDYLGLEIVDWPLDSEPSIPFVLPKGVKVGDQVRKKGTVRIPQGHDQERLSAMMRSNPAGAPSAMFSACITDLDGAKLDATAARRMSSKDRAYLAQLMARSLPGAQTRVKLPCGGCGREQEVDIVGMTGFFGPTT